MPPIKNPNFPDWDFRRIRVLNQSGKLGIQKEMKSPTSERGGNNRNTKGDEIADERARSEEQNPQRGFCDERRASEEEARLLNTFI